MKKSRRYSYGLFPAVVALAIFIAPIVAFAHETGEDEEGPRNLHEMWHTWGWEPGSMIGLALLAYFYGAGLWRLWRASGVGHGIGKWEAWCFLAGWLTLFIALISPLHPLGQVLFSAHMIQHELLMLVAAPLIVLGRPMIAFLHALPARTAHGLGQFSNTAGWRRVWGTISAPFAAWLIHAAVLWSWHAPALFQATLHSEWVHAAQHVSFLLSALLFWWALIHGRRTAVNYGLGVLYLFTTAVHSGLLGALLTFAGSIWYPDYAQTTASWGMTALEDQQAGGLIMWVPACLVYIVAGLIMFAGWLRQSEAAAVRREASAITVAGNELAIERSAT